MAEKVFYVPTKVLYEGIFEFLSRAEKYKYFCVYEWSANAVKIYENGDLVTLFEFDDCGNKTKRIGYDVDGEVVSRSEYAYGIDGKITKFVEYDSWDWITEHYEFEYDENGHIVKKVRYNQDGSVAGYSKFECDKRGNVTREYYEIGGRRRSIQRFKYDRKGRIITKAIYYNTGNYGHDWVEFEYGSDGNLVKRTEFFPAGNISEYKEFKYNSRGALIGMKSCNCKGKVFDSEKHRDLIQATEAQYKLWQSINAYFTVNEVLFFI